METNVSEFDYPFFGDQGSITSIKCELASLADEVKKLVAMQEDAKQKTLMLERLNLIDQKLATIEREDLKEVRSDLAKLRRLSDSNKAWMEKIGVMVEYLMQQDRERSGDKEDHDSLISDPGQ